MHKVVPVFALLGFGVVLAGMYGATIPTAAAAGAHAVATSAPVPFEPAPPNLDVPGPPSVVPNVVPVKRKTTAGATKPRVYQCEMRPLLMGTMSTTVRVCDWRDG